MRRRERRCSIASSSSLEALSAATGAELTANGEHLGQPFGGRYLPLRWTRRHDRDERGDHAGIERITGKVTCACPKTSRLHATVLGARFVLSTMRGVSTSLVRAIIIRGLLSA